MELERITNIGVGRVEIIFGDGIRHVAKVLSTDSLRAEVYEPTPHLKGQLLMRIREAERDLAYMKHGKDWRKSAHGGFWGEPRDWETEIGLQAAKLRPDLFGDA